MAFAFSVALMMAVVSQPVLAQQAPASAPAASQSATTPLVASIAVTGLKAVSEQLVRSQLEVKVGEPYSPSKVARDIRRLSNQGHFDSVKVDAQDVSGGLAITYVVTEKRIIEEIKILGNDKVRVNKIRAVLSWKEGDAFSLESHDKERKAITKLYEEKGLANTSVDINVEEIGLSHVRVVYVIHEGKKARVREITFEGNDTLTAHKLKKIMKTKRAFWFLGGKYNEQKFEDDLGRIVDEYGNIGHLEASVAKTDIAYSEDGKKMDVKIALAEGPQYKVGALNPVNNKVYDNDEIEKLAKVHAGDVHNKGQVTKDAEEIQKGYESSGYVNAEVTPQVAMDRENKTTNVAYNVKEGDLKYVKEVDIVGNNVTKDEVIRRNIAVQPGERFDGQAIKMSERALENTRYFENVRLSVQDIEGDELYSKLMTSVEEGKTGSFNFGVGYSSEERLGGNIELKRTNFDILNWPTFTGGGQIFSTKLQVGDVRNQYNLSFTDPEFLGYPLAFGFDFFDESYDYEDQGDYQEETRGAQIRFGKALSPYLSIRTALRFSDVDYSDLAFAWMYTPTWRHELQPSTTISNSWGLEHNTLDVYRDPTSGHKHELTLTFAGLGGDNDFLKVEHDSTWYKALDKNKKWVLSFRTREGWIDATGSSEWVPISERFFAGGTTTVRGYKNRSIGPEARRFWFSPETEPIGGTMRILENLELKYKLTKQFRFYTFIDGGKVWSDDDFDDGGDMKFSAGIGIGVDIPKMGPIRVDYGIPLNPDSDQGSGRIHLMTGLRF